MNICYEEMTMFTLPGYPIILIDRLYVSGSFSRSNQVDTLKKDEEHALSKTKPTLA
jgi:hypothetical protein